MGKAMLKNTEGVIRSRKWKKAGNTSKNQQYLANL
jgi:hypothetical protein